MYLAQKCQQGCIYPLSRPQISLQCVTELKAHSTDSLVANARHWREGGNKIDVKINDMRTIPVKSITFSAISRAGENNKTGLNIHPEICHYLVAFLPPTAGRVASESHGSAAVL